MILKVPDVVKQHFPSLQPSNVTLNYYTEHSVGVIFMIQVADQRNVNLVGLNWIFPLQLIKNFFLNDTHSYSIKNLPTLISPV